MVRAAVNGLDEWLDSLRRDVDLPDPEFTGRFALNEADGAGAGDAMQRTPDALSHDVRRAALDVGDL